MFSPSILVGKVALDEKFGQLTQFGARLFINSKAGDTGPLQSWGMKDEDLLRMGSILNFSGAKEMNELQRIHMDGDRNKIPMLFMMDVIHGYRTIFPIPLALGASFNIETVKELIDEGVFTEEDVDNSVYKVLKLKEKLGLLDDAYIHFKTSRAALWQPYLFYAVFILPV